MIIKKILNNNVVIAGESQDGKENIIMAMGIGFQKKVGDELAEDASYQIFVLSDEIYQKYVQLTENIDPKAVEIAEDIIRYAQEVHGLKLGEIIHLTMTDHIDGVLSRLKKGQVVTNQLTLEISRIYDVEYKVGLYACGLLEDATEQVISKDEAAFVAMHLLNHRMDLEYSDEEVQTTLTFISDVIKVVETHFHCQYDETSFSYYRFVMHLKGLIKRIYANKPFKDDDTLSETLGATYPDAADCASKVVKMIFLKYGKDVSSEEKSYLILYIEKLNRERE